MSKPVAKKNNGTEPEGENPAVKKEVIRITPPNVRDAYFEFTGESHLSVHHFSAKAQNAMAEQQMAGSQANSKRKRPPKDFDLAFNLARYRSSEGWDGLNAACFRNAAISACRLCGIKMTHAKLAIFVLADGEDESDGTPLVRIWSKKPPEKWIAPARNANGSFDLRARPRWAPGEWMVRLRVRYDEDVFSLVDLTNLFMRVGQQVGIGEGRPDSRESAGLGYGLFSLAIEEGKKAA